MKNNGKSDYTVKTYDKMPSFLAEHADLNESEQVKHFIATYNVCNGYKKNLVIAYEYYCRHSKEL